MVGLLPDGVSDLALPLPLLWQTVLALRLKTEKKPSALTPFAHCACRCLASTFTDVTGRRNGASAPTNLATRRTTVDFPRFCAGYLRRRRPVALRIWKGLI